MKKFTGNTAVKILAVILSFIAFATMIISVVGSLFMLFSDFYTRDFKTLEKNIMQTLAESEIHNLVSMYDDSPNSMERYYSDKNVLYSVKNFHTGEKESNYKGEEYIVDYTVTGYAYRYVGNDGTYYTWGQVEYDHNLKYWYHYATNEQVYETTQKAEFTIYIPKQMQFTDRFFMVNKLITVGYNNRYMFIFLSFASLALCIVIYSYLFASIGHRNGCGDIKVSLINNIPADILSVIVFFTAFLGIWLLSELEGLVMTIVLGAIILVSIYFVALWYLLSVIVQVKAKTLFKHTLVFWLFKQMSKLALIFKHIYKNLRTVYKVTLVVGVFWAFMLIFMGVHAYENDNLIIGFIVISAIVTVIILMCAIAFQRVKQGGEKIVNGDLENKIDTTYMFGDIKDFAESLNNINQGLQAAIDDKMKSERFKTELITNVSHDIKTPLTSIVNYVDLIKKEDCDNSKINEYIEVLDRQSIRLKKLIEDLVEASKASTGNLSVQFERCNLTLLVNQAIGEFSERLEKNNLQLVQSLPDKEIYIMADGRRLWRVLDNLLNNICKYAMQGTRVYIDLTTAENRVTIMFRNISNTPLNITGDELTERFVRGDRSRNTEGSGLGLSIAKSLTELQNGNFVIETDGDLFKAKITFATIK